MKLGNDLNINKYTRTRLMTNELHSAIVLSHLTTPNC